MRRILIALLGCSLLLLGGVYYYFSGKEYIYEFSEEQIREKLSEKLPMSRRYFLIFEVTLDNPRIVLVEGSNRVAAGLDIILNIHVNRSPVALGGTIDVSGSVAYDSERGAFFLTEPVIEHLNVQGVPEKYTIKVSSVVADALGDYYREHPVYSLSAANAKQAAARLVLKNVEVVNKTLVVTVGL